MLHPRTSGSGGGNDPAGGLTLDSGVSNPELLGTLPGNEEWAKARLRDRVDAAIAHEHEEARRGGNHVEALEARPGHRAADQRGRPAHPAGHATEGAPAMIHDLTIGHLDPAAIRDRQAVAVQAARRGGGRPRAGRVPRAQGRASGTAT